MLAHIYLTLGFAAVLAVVFWDAPVLPLHKVKRSRVLRADRASVWRSLMARPADRYLSDEPVEGEPNRRRIVVDTSNGSRKAPEVLTYELIEEIEAEKLVRNIVANHDIAFKPGAELVETWQLQDHPDGCLVTLSHERRLPQSIAALLASRRSIYNALDELQDHCCRSHAHAHAASRIGRVGAATARGKLMSIMLTLLSLGTLTALVNWRLAVLMITIIAIHEIGHLIGFHIAGHKNPRLVLLPFVGGAVASDKPFRSAREEAFVSLTGAGFSALYVIAFMLVAYNQGADFVNIFGVDPGAQYVKEHYAAIMCVGAAALIGIANAFQMIPVPPLDGGHVWRALMHSDHNRFVSYVFPLVALLATITAVATVGVMFGILVGLLCFIWPAAITTRLALPVMSAGEKTLVGSAYVTIMLIHLAPIYVLIRPFI
ncbi:MAG: hypothetical protein KDJ18_02170 [Hyphomicrobiaceae bacterium]|nr:hypothetical protein [Hyphomicrobiaceae bacterium]